MNIIIGGDIIPTSKNMLLFKNNCIQSLLDDKLRNTWFSADYRIANLETPITNNMKKLKKHGLNVKTNPFVMPGIKGLDFSVLCCSNNHILDYGNYGLNETLNNLEKYEIPYIGIGNNAEDYFKFKILSDNQLTVGIYNCCDHEFSCAGIDSPGAISFDCYNTMKAIRKLHNFVDKIIVIYHAGIEFYQYPSPLLQRDCREMVDAGADIVICQHGHCIASYETYKSATIIYGQGHFISNLMHSDLTDVEMLVQIEFNINKKNLISYIPVKVSNEETIVSPKIDEEERILNDFYNRSERLNDKFVQSMFDDYVNTRMNNYVLCFKGHSFINRVKSYIYGNKFVNKTYNRTNLLAIYNYLESRTHEEILKRIFEIWRENDD